MHNIYHEIENHRQQRNDDEHREHARGVELRAGKLTLDGLAEPIEVRSAAVSLTGSTMSISKIAGRIAETPFSASFEKKGTQPAKFSLELDEADAEEIQRILTPTLAREGPGFLARTLRLRGAPPVPAWLKARKAEGTISIASATAGEWKGREVKARVQWDGTTVHFTNISAQLDSGTATGTMDVDLATPVAKYHLEGSVNSVAYHGGSLDLTGTVDAEGIGDALLSSAHAEGTVRGRNIAFAQDADFRVIELVKIARQPELRDLLGAQGSEVIGSTPEEFTARIKAETVKWAQVIKTANIKLDSY